MTQNSKPKQRQPPSLPPGTEEYLSIREVCQALKISRDMFRRMREQGEYPAPDRQLGCLPRWRVTTHNHWVQETTS